MGAHESMEHAEHAEHASGSNKKIALLIAVIALFLALSETLGKGAQTEAISKNVEASNLWAFFQAKSIRRTVVQATAEHAKLSLGADRRRCRQGGAAEADRRLEQDRGALPLGAGNRRRFGRTRQARQACRARARRGDREIPPLRNRLGRLPDRHRAGVRHHHHRHDRAGLGVGRAGGRGHRDYRARPLRAASAASALSCERTLSAARSSVMRAAMAAARIVRCELVELSHALRDTGSPGQAGRRRANLPRFVHALAKALDQPQRAR